MSTRSHPPLRFEDVPHEGVQSFTTRQFVLPHFPFVWHHHPEIEITFIQRGNGMRYVGDSIEAYEPGDLCLLGPYVPHTWMSPAEAGEVASLVVHFLPSFWEASLAKLPELKRINTLLARGSSGLSFDADASRRCAEPMRRLFAEPPTSPRRIGRLLETLEILADAATPRPLATTAGLPHHDGHAIITRVLARLHDAGSNPPPQAEIAAAMRMSPPAFSRLFKRQMGKTYVEYATDWRLGHACRLLAHSDDDITSIAFASGFNNLSNFNRQFKAARGMTPRAYRALSHTH